MTQDKTRLSIRAASKVASVSERTLRRMVADGRLSLVQEPDGSKRVDVSELLRLGILRGKSAATADTAADAASRDAARVTELEEMLADAKSERDRWHEEATAVRADLRAAQEALRREQEQNAELTKRMLPPVESQTNHAAEQAQAVGRQLDDARARPTERPKGFFARLFGG